MSLTLVRYIYGETVTIGFIQKDGKYICDTLERPWLGNKRNLSCIPEGIYRIFYREDTRFSVKHAYVLENVPDRKGILIHVANEVSELEGCIAVGVRFGDLLQKSTLTFDRLRELVGARDVLRIVGATHEF